MKKISIAILLMLVLCGTAIAAGPTLPYGSTSALGAWPKPLRDWFHKYIIDPHSGVAGGYADPAAPFDTPLFDYTTPVAVAGGRAHKPFFSGQTNTFHTSNEELQIFFDSLPQDFLRWEFVGNITTYDGNGSGNPVHNLGYPLVVLTKGPYGPVFHPEEVKALGKPVYFVQPTNHGNEPAGAEAAISIIKRLALDEIRLDDGTSVLDKISVVIMPRINVDGYYWQTRGTYSARGVNNPDHNRDGTMMISPQVRMNSAILNQYQPHFGYDSHQMGWTTGFPGGNVTYYTSGVDGQGTASTTGTTTVTNNTIDYTGTTTLARQYSYILWAPIDDPSKFADTPQVLSDWQDKSMEYMKDVLEEKMHMHIFPYALGTASTSIRDPKGIDINTGTATNPVLVNYPSRRPALWRAYDVIPCEGYGDGFLGLKQMVAWCMESPSSGGDGFTVRMFNNYTAMKEQMRFLAMNADEIYKDVADARASFRTNSAPIALWNHQTIDGQAKITRADGTEYQFQTRRKKELKIGAVRGTVPQEEYKMIPDPDTGEHAFEYDVPFWMGNRARKAGRRVTRPYAYIIDPDHVADGNHINADLAAFRVGYTGSQVYQLAEPVTVEVEASKITTIRSMGTGNGSPTVSGTVTYADWDLNGNFIGDYGRFSMVDGGDIYDSYLGGGDNAGSSFGIQQQRIAVVEHIVEYDDLGQVHHFPTITKTFPAGSYVVPIQGDKANWGAMHAWFMLESLGKRNLGNSYWRFRPGDTSYGSATQLALQWPFKYWQHYFPVEQGGYYPAYRFMKDYNAALKLERAYADQPFIKGATFSAGFPVSISNLEAKGINVGEIKKIDLGYNFMAEGTFDINKGEEDMTASQLWAPATYFEVMVPKAYDGVPLQKWYLYDWNENEFFEAVPHQSQRSGANYVTVTGANIGAGHDVALVAVAKPLAVTPSASVKKLNGNKNELLIEVVEDYPNGAESIVYRALFSIDNNAAGTYQVGPYKVYVDTKGNTQIRECYIVK